MMTTGTDATFRGAVGQELSWTARPMPSWLLIACSLLMPVQYLTSQATPAGICNAYIHLKIESSPTADAVEVTDTVKELACQLKGSAAGKLSTELAGNKFADVNH